MGVHVSHFPLAADPLIDEANRRKRRRRLLVVGVLAVAALAAGLWFGLRPSGQGGSSAGATHHSGAAGTTRPEARGIANHLLREVPLPRGARRVSQRVGSSVVHSPNYGTNIFTQYEYRHAFWKVRERLGSVEIFLRKHSPRNFTFEALNRDTYPYRGASFSGRSAGGRIQSRVLVSLHRSKGFTIVRVDAGVPWTVPRSPLEVLPASVAEVDIHSVPQAWMRHWGVRSVSRHVTNPRDVALIVGWFNDLNVVQPNTYADCLGLSATAQYTFRSASGAQVASAAVPSVGASSCAPIQFTLNGRQEPSLVDSTPLGGHGFVYRMQRLLGVRFRPRIR